MKLSEAMERLDYIVFNNKLKRGAKSIEAVRLGIEALKRVDFSRRDPNRPSEPLLPGETEE